MGNRIRGSSRFHAIMLCFFMSTLFGWGQAFAVVGISSGSGSEVTIVDLQTNQVTNVVSNINAQNVLGISVMHPTKPFVFFTTTEISSTGQQQTIVIIKRIDDPSNREIGRAYINETGAPQGAPFNSMLISNDGNTLFAGSSKVYQTDISSLTAAATPDAQQNAGNFPLRPLSFYRANPSYRTSSDWAFGTNIFSMDTSNDDQYLFAATGDDVHVFKLSDGSHFATLIGNNGDPQQRYTNLTIAPDGRLMITLLNRGANNTETVQLQAFAFTPDPLFPFSAPETVTVGTIDDQSFGIVSAMFGITLGQSPDDIFSQTPNPTTDFTVFMATGNNNLFMIKFSPNTATETVPVELCHPDTSVQSMNATGVAVFEDGTGFQALLIAGPSFQPVIINETVLQTLANKSYTDCPINTVLPIGAQGQIGIANNSGGVISLPLSITDCSASGANCAFLNVASLTVENNVLVVPASTPIPASGAMNHSVIINYAVQAGDTSAEPITINDILITSQTVDGKGDRFSLDQTQGCLNLPDKQLNPGDSCDLVFVFAFVSDDLPNCPRHTAQVSIDYTTQSGTDAKRPLTIAATYGNNCKISLNQASGSGFGTGTGTGTGGGGLTDANTTGGTRSGGGGVIALFSLAGLSIFGLISIRRRRS